MSKHLLSKLLNDSDIYLFDVGAKGGTKELNILRSFTSCFGFEPNPEEAKQLIRQNTNFKHYECFPYALGSEDSNKFLNISKNPSYSSFLDVNWEVIDIHHRYMPIYEDIKNMLDYQSKIRVPVRKLDSLTFGHIDLLKIDTQGTELGILNGASNKLINHEISFIKCEVSFIKVYNNCALFSDIDSYIRSFGFHFIDCIYLPEVVSIKPLIKNKHNKGYKDRIKYSTVGNALYVLDLTHLSKEHCMTTGLILADYGYFSFAEYYLQNSGIPHNVANKLLRYFYNKQG